MEIIGKFENKARRRKKHESNLNRDDSMPILANFLASHCSARRYPASPRYVKNSQSAFFGRSVPDRGAVPFAGLKQPCQVYRSRTKGVFAFLRSFFQTLDSLAPTVANVEAVRVYPLAGTNRPPRKYGLTDRDSQLDIFVNTYPISPGITVRSN